MMKDSGMVRAMTESTGFDEIGYLVGRSVEKGSSPLGRCAELSSVRTLLGFEEFTKRPPKSDADVAGHLIGRARRSNSPAGGEGRL